MKYIGLWVFLFALALNVVVGVSMGLDRPLESDAYQYLQVARSLAAGQGYVNSATFWPDQPTMQRLPGWPCLVALVLRLTPGVTPDMAMRLLGLLLNAFIAWLLVRLTLALWNQWVPALVAGLAYALHPTGLYLAYNGSSEMFFLALVCAGLWLGLCGGRLRYAGFLLLGLACLERANFLLFILCLPALVLLCYGRRPIGFAWPTVSAMVVCLLLFLLPAWGWTVRNYKVCGHFPVLSTLRGQTFYGGNNPVTADTLEYWGYWVFPDSIPGERKLAELARDKSEYEADKYYFQKGLTYVRRNWFALPRLALGKLVRAYVPVPWKPAWGSYATNAYRGLVLLGALLGLSLYWRQTPFFFRTAWLAMAATSVVTVLVFWGCARFAFAFEPFLLPFVGAGLVCLAERWRKRPSATERQ